MTKYNISKITENLNNIFNAIGYYVRFNSKAKSICIYERETDRGMDFIGEALPHIGEDMNVGVFDYNGDRYTNILHLIKAMEEENKKLPFPSYTYDPMFHNLARFETKIDWYMRKVLGFSSPSYFEYPGAGDDRIYVLRNAYGEIISRISIHYKEDRDTENIDISGYIYKSFRTSFSIISTDFKNLDECIAGINGMLEPEYLLDIVSKLGVINNMTTERNYSSEFSSIDDNFRIHKGNIKELTKKLLKDALARIEKEEKNEKD